MRLIQGRKRGRGHQKEAVTGVRGNGDGSSFAVQCPGQGRDRWSSSSV